MRIGVDATPLLGQRSGIGRYVAGVIDGFAELAGGPELLLTLFSVRGHVPGPLPRGARPAPRRAPARLLRRTWRSSGWPPAEWLTGSIDVFHGTNFVLPPTRRAAGVVTVHDLAFLRFPETVTGDAAEYRDLVPAALRRGAHVLAVTEAMASEIGSEYDLPADRITVAPHGVDPLWALATPPSAADRARLGLPARYLLFTGNLEPRKNLGLLVTAHRAARRADPGTPPLVMVGPAGWGDRWQGGPPDPSDVVLAGYLSDHDLRTTVAGATAVCMPSRYEGFGLPVLEALAAGRPVLVSDIPAHREVGGDQVMVIPADDVDGWAQALTSADRAPGTPPGRRARAGGYTWAASARAHLTAYRRAAEAR